MGDTTTLGTSLTPQDIENRFVKIEQTLATLQGSQSGNSVSTRLLSTPPPVAGWRRTISLGIITFIWNPTIASNLSGYELQIADNIQFLRYQTISIPPSATSYTYTEGDPQIVYYARLRAVIGSTKGQWTATINGTTGLASYKDLEVGAAGALTQDETISFSPATVGISIADIATPRADGNPTYDALVNATYGSAQITTIDGGVVVPSTIFEFDIEYDYSLGVGANRVTLQFLRNNDVVDQYDVDFLSATTLNTSRMTVPAFASPDVPGPGTWVYSTRVIVTRDTNIALMITPVRLLIELFEYRR